MSTSTVPNRVQASPDLVNTCAVVPSEDSHQSEYIAPCDARRGQIPRRLSQHTY
jgi:hypothetical protein